MGVRDREDGMMDIGFSYIYATGSVTWMCVRVCGHFQLRSMTFMYFNIIIRAPSNCLEGVFILPLLLKISQPPSWIYHEI